MKNIIFICSLLIAVQLSHASEFTTGPVIKDFGKATIVESANKLKSDQKFKVVFDIAKQGSSDKVNRSIDSLARFINLHVKAGVKPENIELALVVHGKASNDVLNNEAYAKKFEQENPNTTLLNELLNNQTKVYLCGQSAAYYQIDSSDLHPGVQMAHSAMTAHALLQQQGFTFNPF